MYPSRILIRVLVVWTRYHGTNTLMAVYRPRHRVEIANFRDTTFDVC